MKRTEEEVSSECFRFIEQFEFCLNQKQKSEIDEIEQIQNLFKLIKKDKQIKKELIIWLN